MVGITLRDHVAGYPQDIRTTVLKIAEVSKTVCKSFLNRLGSTDHTNIYGEKQVKLDEWADKLFISELGKTGLAKVISTEEQSEILEFPSESNIALTIDPLDGSSLIGVNLTVGTIIGIHRDSVLKTGNQLIGALYILYGPLTLLVYSLGSGVHEFVLDKNGEYILEEENIQMPSGKIYSPGALRSEWLPYHKDWINRLESEGYKLRYSGSFVADVHQILHKGGVFSYPAFKGGDSGKLRLLYECVPMGYIVSQAGGAASNGNKNILDIFPEKFQVRTPIYIGGKREIQLIAEMMEDM